MEKYRKLIKNTSIITISTVGCKLLGFLMIPLYTNYLSTADYGTFDLFDNLSAVLVPLLTASIYEAVFRFSIKNEEEKKIIVSIGLRKILISILVIIFFLIINHFLQLFKTIDLYSLYFFLLFFTQVFSAFAVAFARAQSMYKEMAISGIIGTLITVCLYFVLLVVLKLGLEGYMIAITSGVMIQDIYLSIKTKTYNYITTEYDKDLAKRMVKFSAPLGATTITWRLNSTIDRLSISVLCGIAVNGLYAIASKLSLIVDILQNAFITAWSTAAVEESESNDSLEYYADVFEIYYFVVFLGVMLLVSFSRLLARIMFSKEFYEAWRFAPILLVASAFNALSGYSSGIFMAQKNTKICATSTIIGSFVNIALNVVFIKLIGPIGAAIATLIGCMLIWIIRAVKLKTIINRYSLIKKIIVSVIAILQAMIMSMKEWDALGTMLISIICITGIIALNIEPLKKIKKMFVGN